LCYSFGVEAVTARPCTSIEPDVLALVAAPRRREILRLVWHEEREAGAIHRELDAVAPLTFGAVSQHLRRLAGAGLVTVRPDGRRRFYQARPEALGPIATWLEAMWGDALARLQLATELEAARRGPRSRLSPRNQGEP
jgi:DNA-binding transcriptional ArsR family regulator